MALEGSEGDQARCAECDTAFGDGDQPVVTDGGQFCQDCFARLSLQVQAAIEEQSRDINWGMACIGGLGGAALGVVAWWGFTAVTSVAFGLVAIVIGIGVGQGVLMLSGHKRSRGLQILSVGIAGLAYFYATYLVNRTFLLRAYAEQGEAVALPWLPDPSLLIEVIKLDFGVMDLIFLGIVVFEAWRRPAPLQLGS